MLNASKINNNNGIPLQEHLILALFLCFLSHIVLYY